MACAVIGIVIGGGVVAQPSGAQNRPQLKRPHEEEPEQKPVEVKKKKVKGPRAIAVLQLSGSKATLIPVAIQVDGKFYDASAYKADPVPMALESGTVYEGVKAGESQGLFTTSAALHSKSVDGPAWMGTGSYFANGTEAAKTTRKAEDVPIGLDSSGDEPPRLTRKSGTGTDSTQKGGSATGKGSADAPSKGDEAKKTGSPSGEAAGSGDKKDPATKSDPAQSSTGTSAGKVQEPVKEASAEKGSDAAKQDKPQEEGSYYRPTLRRGKPTQGAPAEEDVSPKASGAAAATPNSGVGAKATQVMAAISDAGGPQLQSYKFFWKEGEEDERRKQMLTLAGEELRTYISARTKGAIGVKPQAQSKSDGSIHKVGKPAEPIFENIQFQAFDLWKNNQPVMILSAEAHFAGDADGALSPGPYSITLVSRTDIYGSLRKLYSGVTDKFHLDVTPRLELIDAVDADGDGRGELLFRESADASKGYVIYRATGDKLWKMFDSLGAE